MQHSVPFITIIIIVIFIVIIIIIIITNNTIDIIIIEVHSQMARHGYALASSVPSLSSHIRLPHYWWRVGPGGGRVVVVVMGYREEGVFLQVYRLFSNISIKHCNDTILRKVLLCLPVILQVSQNNTTHLVLVLPNHLNESSMSGRTASARHSHC